MSTAVWRGLESRRLLRDVLIQSQFGQHRIVRQYSTRLRLVAAAARRGLLQRGGHFLPLERGGQLGEPEAELPLERRVSLLRLKNFNHYCLCSLSWLKEELITLHCSSPLHYPLTLCFMLVQSLEWQLI